MGLVERRCHFWFDLDFFGPGIVRLVVFLVFVRFVYLFGEGDGLSGDEGAPNGVVLCWCWLIGMAAFWFGVVAGFWGRYLILWLLGVMLALLSWLRSLDEWRRYIL